MQFEVLQAAVLEGKPRLVEKLVREALQEGVEPGTILERGLLQAMECMSRDYLESDHDVARVLGSARAMKRGMEELTSALEQHHFEPCGTVILGTAGGDLHDIGKNVVAIMFRSYGFQVIDLGVDVAAGRFVQALGEHPETDVVCVSSLLTTSAPEVRHIVQALGELKNRSEFYVMVGGGSVSEEFAMEIGADAYTGNAVEAAKIARCHVLEQKQEEKR